MDAGVGEELGGGEALGHGVLGVSGNLMEGFDGVLDVAVGADFGLKLAEFFAGLELFFACLRVEEIS